MNECARATLPDWSELDYRIQRVERGTAIINEAKAELRDSQLRGDLSAANVQIQTIVDTSVILQNETTEIVRIGNELFRDSVKKA